MSSCPLVSVLIPVYQEEKYIAECIDSLLMQDYPSKDMEWLFLDGGSFDNTLSIIEEYQKSNDCLIKIIHNPYRTAPHAMNIGIQHAKGKYLIRIDAHATYDRDYISKCVRYLGNMDIDNVGGIAETVGRGRIGIANADILSSVFGVGNSAFRTTKTSGFVDTVPFGAFRREVFEKVGYFNPNLPRSEDNDINSRIRSAGGKVYLASDIHFRYICRDTFSGLLRQGLYNGNALFLTLRENPSAMGLRHFVPFGFVMSLILLPILAIFSTFAVLALLFELSLYFLLDFYFSTFVGNSKLFLYKFVAYPMLHITYGIGSLLGLFGLILY